jgi:VWFA-related protein
MKLPITPLVLLGFAALASAPPAAPQGQAPAAPAPAQASRPAAAGAQTPSFPTGVEQVVVDVVVTDKKGNPIRGLTKEGMTVSEDGVPQAVTSFEAITLPDKPSAAAPPPPRVSINTDPSEQRGRTFVIVFDDTHLTPTKANQAKAAVASFLEKGTREGDRVTLVSTAGATWWTARMESGRPKLLDMVKRLDGRYIPDTAMDRMSDYEALRIHDYHDQQVVDRVLRRWENYGVAGVLDQNRNQDSMTAGTVDDPLVTGKASEVYFMAQTRIRATLEVLERAINGLVAAKGRKSVILVSEGFIYDNNLDEFKRVNDASRRANAAIYFVNARGLDAMPLEMTAQFGPALPDQDVGFAFAETMDAVAGAETVASDSGGFVVRNTNDLSQGVQRIANETQAYYLLGYTPTNVARDGKFRKIQVKLANGRGLQVRARKGYFAPGETQRSAENKRGIDPVIQSALDSPWAQDGIPLRMTDFVLDEKALGKASVLIATDIDTNAVDFEQKDGRSYGDLQLLLIVAHRESGEFFRYDQGVNMKLLPITRERLSHSWFPVVREFELKPGDYQAKIVVRDTRSGRVGTVLHEFDVPPLDQFRVATPLLADSRQKGPNGELGGPVVTARRAFTAGSDVFCQIEVYGAKTDAKQGMPRVVQGYVVRRSDGVVLTSMPPSEIKPTSLGHLSRLFGFRLTDAQPGDYEIFMTVQDELAGKQLEFHEPFKVLPASGPASAPGAQP